MSKLIVCLGYRLEPNDSISPVLINRLLDVVSQYNDNEDFTLLLMGSSLYGDSRKEKISEASVMEKYLRDNFKEKLKGAKMIIEETTASTVEQLCYLKEFIEKEKLDFSNLVIVSSEFFGDRVRLYAEYVFGTIDGIIFIDSIVPAEIREKFQKAEEFKLKEGKKWLMRHEKGNSRRILKEQIEFQNKVIGGETKQPPIS